MEEAELVDEPAPRDEGSSEPEPEPADEAPGSETDEPVTGDAGDAPEDVPWEPGTEQGAVEDDAAASPDEPLDPVGSETVGAAPVARSEPEPAPRHASDSIIPLLIGGALAALIGFFVARYLESQSGGPDMAETAAAVEAQAQDIAELRATVENLPPPRDPAPVIEEAIAPLSQRIDETAQGLAGAGERLDTLAADLQALSERVETIAMRPEAPAVEPGQFVDPTEFDAALAEFRADVTSAIEDAKAEIAEARAEAARISDAAFAAQQEAARRAAWAAVEAAIKDGQPYEDPLAAAAGTMDIEIPPVIAEHAADGIPTLSDLRTRFPAAARGALDASIRASADEGGGPVDRVVAFFRVQTGVRSLRPRDGDDPDAVLSRAEAALADGNLEDALAQIEALPPEGAEHLAPWVDAARTRLAVLEAAATVTQELKAE